MQIKQDQVNVWVGWRAADLISKKIWFVLAGAMTRVEKKKAPISKLLSVLHFNNFLLWPNMEFDNSIRKTNPEWRRPPQH
jgi:hypothetical protein